MGHADHAHDDVDPAQFYRRGYWNERYGAERVWSGNPNPVLVRYAADLPPGTALDVGSGEGADVLWLARRGWTVTGADISDVALRACAELAEAAGVADRVSWQQADVLTWAPPTQAFDLVSAQFLHLPPAARADVLARLAAAVRVGGTLLVVGHHPSDMEVAGMRRPHLPDMFATGEQMAEALDPAAWTIEASAPTRAATDPDGHPVTITDAVLLAVRRA
jgi:SAM-dependent methyltransferase